MALRLENEVFQQQNRALPQQNMALKLENEVLQQQNRAFSEEHAALNQQKEELKSENETLLSIIEELIDKLCEKPKPFTQMENFNALQTPKNVSYITIFLKLYFDYII